MTENILHVMHTVLLVIGGIFRVTHLGNPAIYGSFESVHRTADVGSSMDTFLCGIKLRTLAVLWTLFGCQSKVSIKLLDLGNVCSSMETFKTAIYGRISQVGWVGNYQT